MDNYYHYPFRGNHPVTSPYGPRDGGFHPGVDFGWDPAEGPSFPVLASAAGDVIYYADEGIGGGRTMTLRHNGGEQSRYYHLDHNVVQVGDRVDVGQWIAMSGDTGGVAPHLHFEIHNSLGQTVDPLPLLEPQIATPVPPTPPKPVFTRKEEGNQMKMFDYLGGTVTLHVNKAGDLVQNTYTYGQGHILVDRVLLSGNDPSVQPEYIAHGDVISVACVDAEGRGRYISFLPGGPGDGWIDANGEPLFP